MTATPSTVVVPRERFPLAPERLGSAIAAGWHRGKWIVDCKASAI